MDEGTRVMAEVKSIQRALHFPVNPRFVAGKISSITSHDSLGSGNHTDDACQWVLVQSEHLTKHVVPFLFNHEGHGARALSVNFPRLHLYLHLDFMALMRSIFALCEARTTPLPLTSPG